MTIPPIQPHRWIDRPDQLPELAAALDRAPWIALDSEADSMFVYRERLCLLQLNLGGDLWLVDTLALLRAEDWSGLKPGENGAAPPRSTALDPLHATLARTDRTLWIHGGEYDCALLRRDFGVVLGGLWDTQQAGQFVGWEKTNYGALVERVRGVVLAKGHAQYDWGTRPLDPEALTYAIDDVVHLPLVGEHLRAAIAEADLVEEHAIACQAVAATTSEGGGFDPLGFWRIKGVRDVSREHLPVLAALYAWRDGVARQENRPAGRIVNNELLLAVVRQCPTSFQHLKRTGLKSWLLSTQGETLIEVIRAARDSGTVVPPPPRHREVDEAEEKREDRLKDWRRGEAGKRAVPLQVVLPAKALDHIKRHGAGDLASVPQLGPKRIALYGRRLTELCSA